VDQRRRNELTCRPTEHADALGDADRGCEVARRKAVSRQIDSRNEGIGGAGTLQEAPGGRGIVGDSLNGITDAIRRQARSSGSMCGMRRSAPSRPAPRRT
jgi:hypothetical protein